MTTQTEAERLAEWLDDLFDADGEPKQAAAELRRQASLINQLMDEVARLKQAVADEREMGCHESCDCRSYCKKQQP